MSSISHILAGMIILAVLIIIVSIIIYNRRLDKVVKGELHDTHNPIPEPKTTAGVLYKTILIVIVSVSLISIGALSGTLISLQGTVQDLETTNSEIWRQVCSLQEMVEEQNKEVSQCDLYFENVDYDTQTAEMIVKVRLKKFADDTEATITINGKNVVLQKDEIENGVYYGSVKVGFFEELTDASILIKTAGIYSAESIPFGGSLAWNFFPFPALSGHFSTDRTGGKLKYEGAYTILLADDTESATFDLPKVTDAKLTYMTSGRDLKTVDITQQVLNGEEIVLEQGLDLENDLTLCVELTTDLGFKISQEYMVLHEGSYDPEKDEMLWIEDPSGTVIWERSMRD